LFVAPGNAGTASVATNLSISFNDFDAIANAVLENNIELVIVGPEEPLVNGIVDYFESREDLAKVKLIGPNKAGAQLEGSKDFSKKFMQKYAFLPLLPEHLQPKAGHWFEYLESHPLPIVLKADGLAAGKGVIIAEKHAEAEVGIQRNAFGWKIRKRR
jgi:phosphoribosylamine--glycine ligase